MIWLGALWASNLFSLCIAIPDSEPASRHTEWIIVFHRVVDHRVKHSRAPYSYFLYQLMSLVFGYVQVFEVY